MSLEQAAEAPGPRIAARPQAVPGTPALGALPSVAAARRRRARSVGGADGRPDRSGVWSLAPVCGLFGLLGLRTPASIGVSRLFPERAETEQAHPHEALR